MRQVSNKPDHVKIDLFISWGRKLNSQWPHFNHSPQILMISFVLFLILCFPLILVSNYSYYLRNTENNKTFYHWFKNEHLKNVELYKDFKIHWITYWLSTSFLFWPSKLQAGKKLRIYQSHKGNQDLSKPLSPIFLRVVFMQQCFLRPTWLHIPGFWL